MRRALGPIQRDPGPQIDSGVQVAVFPLLQRRAGDAVLVVHVHELVLVRLVVQPRAVVGVQGDGQVVGVVLGQDDEDARFGVHEAVGGRGDVLAAGVGAVVVVFLVQGGADDPADLVLGFGEDGADYVAERGVAGPDFGVFDGRSGDLEMRD